MFEIIRYTDRRGRDVLETWLDSLQDERAVSIIITRLNRLLMGNFGDSKGVGSGVNELRIDFGPGYRVYYSRVGSKIILLLGGGSKKRQSRDIANAILNLSDYTKGKDEN